MPTQLPSEELRKFIAQELPAVMETDPYVRQMILDLAKGHFADKERTEDRIDRILEELKRDREENARKWEAQEGKWETQERKWEAQERKWEAQERKWEAQERKWEAWERKWEENQETIREMLSELKRLDQKDRELERKHEGSIGALGARWGLQSEGAFRDGLKSILEESFGVQVERYLDFDTDGGVFGRPDQIELDLIIYNGKLIICEIKSSANKSDIYTFWRKKKFYEEKHDRKADRSLIISPMVDPRAKKTADELEIEVFGYADDVAL